MLGKNLFRNSLIIVAVFILGLYVIGKQRTKMTTTTVSLTPTPTASVNKKDSEEKMIDHPRIETVADNLEIPWDLVFLPDGSALFTERAGRVRKLDENGNLVPENVAKIGEVAHIGEGGLLGIEKHPEYYNNHFIYLYYTYRQGLNIRNKVVRYIYQNEEFNEDLTIIDDLPGSINHNGGRIRFGPDKLLYVTTGDAGSADQAQNIDSLAGKILRMNDDGTIPEDNPFGSEVYSYGHRNPQGITWDDHGRLWETEHGSSATDEVNLIKPGLNYGWPEIRGKQAREGMVSPVFQSGSDTWAPSGMTFLGDSFYFSGLRGNSLFKAQINGEELIMERYFEGQYGRLRAVVTGPDDLLYILTSNRDGRGNPAENDDRILRVNPDKL